ncbi:efflux RND transporter permease subunit [Desulfosudis oleivorans]|nr:MMPL family transporter [Desulfosudis oleivorans]
MKSAKAAIEAGFERWALALYRRPRVTLLVLAALTGFFLFQMPRLDFDTSSESLLHADDPYRLAYDRFREDFGQDRNIILGITGPNIFSSEFLGRLQALHREIEETVPHVKRVKSLVTARHVTGENDFLHVGELLESWPEEPMDMGQLRQQVMENPFYRNFLISEDGDLTAIVIETDAVIASAPASNDEVLAGFSDDAPAGKTGSGASDTEERFIGAPEIREIVDAVTRLIPRYQAPDFQIRFSGSPVVVDLFNRAVATDMTRCALYTLVVITLAMGLLFRRVSGVCLPLIVVTASVISALGIMAMAGVKIKIMTAILPVFILCVGVADSVHVLTIFFREYRPGASRAEAVAHAMGHSGLPVLLTSLTTAAGLLSFSFAEISAIGEMGIFSAVGVFMALFYTICLLPPLLALLPLRPGRASAGHSRAMDRVLSGLARFATTHPKKIVAGGVFLMILSLALLPRLRYVDHVLNYFSDRMQVKHDMVYIDRELRGIISFEVIVDTNRENGLHEPDQLRRIDDAARQVKAESAAMGPEFAVAKIFSLTDVVKEINQALHNDDPAFYTIPEERRLVAQELLLFENSGSDELEPVVDTTFSKTRVSIKVPWLDSVGLYRLSEQIRRVFEITFAGHADTSLTGMSLILARTLPATLSSMEQSYLLAAVVISVLMVLLAGDIRIGLLAMFPNLLPILAVMGALAAANIHLDMTVLMIGSIAIGLVVDDTMHFIHHFRRHLDRVGDPAAAVRLTLLGAGRALLITTLVLAGGFLALTAATMPHMVRFGLLLTLVLVLALAADFILAPALMVLTAKKPPVPHYEIITPVPVQKDEPPDRKTGTHD